MKKYLMIFSVLAIVACTNSKTKEEVALETANKEEMIRQRAVDSMAIVNLEEKQELEATQEMEAKQHTKATAQGNNSGSKNQQTASQNTKTAPKKGMSNKTKGALIGAGVGIVAGAATGAAVSDDKVKGAVIGGTVGGAVGTGVGYGIGAEKDKKAGNK